MVSVGFGSQFQRSTAAYNHKGSKAGFKPVRVPDRHFSHHHRQESVGRMETRTGPNGLLPSVTLHFLKVLQIPSDASWGTKFKT